LIERRRRRSRRSMHARRGEKNSGEGIAGDT
jgi:hypothetical protein